MTGYFSRLLKQTGLPAAPDPGWEEAAPTGEPFASPDLGEITGFEVEAHKLMETQTGKTQTILEAVEKEMAPRREIWQRKFIEESRAGQGAAPGKALPGRSPRRADQERPTSAAADEQKAGLQEGESGDLYLSRRPRGKPLEREGEPGPEQFKEIELRTLPPAPRAAPRKAGRGAAPQGQASGSKAVTGENLRRTVAEEVRRWVASQPGLTTTEQRTRVAAEVTKQVQEALPGALDEKPGFPGHRRPEPKSPYFSGPEVYELHLSIGAIRVTLNQGEEGIQPRRPTPAKREGQRLPEAGSSRLSRRYIVP